jgi:hypothetical protein
VPRLQSCTLAFALQLRKITEKLRVDSKSADPPVRGSGQPLSREYVTAGSPTKVLAEGGDLREALTALLGFLSLAY